MRIACRRRYSEQYFAARDKGLIGSGDRGELTFIDLLSVLSFIIGILNLDENLTQSDKQDLQDSLNKKMDAALNEIHGHLRKQDAKLDMIIGGKYENN